MWKWLPNWPRKCDRAQESLIFHLRLSTQTALSPSERRLQFLLLSGRGEPGVASSGRKVGSLFRRWPCPVGGVGKVGGRSGARSAGCVQRSATASSSAKVLAA